jgi:Xaa-Pro aminopeptidase
VTVADFKQLTTDAPIDWVGIGDLIPQCRAIKDEFELDLLRQACSATCKALENVLPTIRKGATELQVARLLDDAMRDLGTDGPGFGTIVAAGPNSAIPHHEPTGRRIEPGDFVKMDFGARVGGYHADMTRTIVVGQPEPWQQEIYQVVADAQRTGRDALAPGVAAADVDSAAREVIAAAGFGDQFGHGLGHGVGLEIHEVPFLGATSTDRIEATVPVTVEPGIYLPGRGGVRIEDTVVVHHDRVEILTTFPRDLLVVA